MIFRGELYGLTLVVDRLVDVCKLAVSLKSTRIRVSEIVEQRGLCWMIVFSEINGELVTANGNGYIIGMSQAFKSYR